jgi:hypothetical protein
VSIDRIDRRIARDHGDLRPRPGITRHRLDLDDAVIDLRHLLGEQLRHELRVSARQEDLRTARLGPYVIDVRPYAVAVLEVLARQKLVAAQDRFGAA